MLKKICVAMLTCWIVLLQVASAAALGVELSHGAQLYTDDSFLVDINITFQNPKLYTENVYLSYQILNETGEAITSKNARVPVTLKEDGTAFVTVELKCSENSELQDVSKAIIRFDLIDETNEYWFSERELISWVGEEVCFDRSLLGTGRVQPDSTNISANENGDASIEKQSLDRASIILNMLIWLAIIALVSKKYVGRAVNKGNR